MFKNVFQIRELVVLELEFDELCGGGSLEVRSRRELVGQPELSIGHGDEMDEDEVDGRGRSRRVNTMGVAVVSEAGYGGLYTPKVKRF